MVKGSSFIDDWIAEGEARGEAKGRAEGEAAGKTEEARQMALRVLSKRFGELPDALIERIQAADAEWCERLVDRALEVESIEDVMRDVWPMNHPSRMRTHPCQPR